MPFVIDYDNTTQQVVTDINRFSPSSLQYNSSGATLVRLYSYVVLVEDCSLNAATKKYVPNTNLKPITGRFSFSEYLPLSQDKSFSICLKTDLNDVLAGRHNLQAWVFLGAELCRRNNKGIEVLYNASVCKLVQSFVCSL